MEAVLERHGEGPTARTMAEAEAAIARLTTEDIDHLFLVACGGSLAVMHTGKAFLDQHARRLSSDVLNADEFVARASPLLGPRSLVILCSQTGTTRETVAASDFARSRKAPTIAMTLDPGSPLADASDHVVSYEAPYTTGTSIDPARSNHAVLLSLLSTLLDLKEGCSLRPGLGRSLPHLGAAIEAAKGHWDPSFDAYAPRLAGEPVIHTVAAGADWGAAYSFSICVLMEMQRIHSQAIHADEFFHGPFEVADPATAFIVMQGLGPARRQEERAARFLHRVGDPARILVVDAKELETAGQLDRLERPFREALVPLLMFDALWGFAYRLAAHRGIPMLTGRRYMKVLTDY